MTVGCVDCGAALRVEDRARCASCAAALPPLEARGGRWSPLSLGGLSLFCDPLLIFTVLTISRGLSELREVRRREAAGHWDPSHERVRTGAVWGIALALLRPVVLAAVAVCIPGLVPPPAPVPAYDELGEILARVDAEDDTTRHLADEHLRAIATDFDEDDVIRILARAAEVEARARRSSLVEHALRATTPIAYYQTHADQLEGLYPTLTRDVRERVLARLAELRDGDYASRVVALAGIEPSEPAPPSLPLPALIATDDRVAVAAPLLDLPSSHPYHDAAITILAAGCRPYDPAPLSTRRAQIIDAAADRRLALAPAPHRPPRPFHPAHVEAIERALEPLAVLGCLRGDDADRALEDALGDEEPEIALRALTLLRARGRSVGDEVIARLAADPMTRGPLERELDRTGEAERIPPRFRAPRALAEADAYAWLRDRRLYAVHVVWTARDVDVDSRQEVHAARVLLADGSERRLVVGPYPSRDAHSLGVDAAIASRSNRTPFDLFGARGEEGSR